MPSSAPISTVPPEILLHVFGYLLPTYLATLQLVCRVWKDVLHETSHLWTGINIAQHPMIPLVDGLDIASTRVGRAGTLPLIISWKLNLKEAELTDEVKAAIMKFLRHAPPSRWAGLFLRDTSGFPEEILKSKFSSLRLLNMDLPMKNINLSLLDSIDQTATSIEVLRVVSKWADLVPYVSNILNRVVGMEIFDEEVELHLPKNVLRLKLFIFPEYLDGMQHLTSLTVERMELPLLNNSELRGLVSLDIGNAPFIQGEDFDPDITLSLPNLLHLKMPANAPNLLEYVVAPKLQDLRLQEVWSVVSHEEDESLSTKELSYLYLALIGSDKFRPSVKSLTLTYQFEADLLLILIPAASKVQTLDVTVKGLLEAAVIFRALVPYKDAIPENPEWNVCPNLTYLIFRYKGSQEIKGATEEMCEELLRARSSAGLKRLRFVVGDVTEKIMMMEAERV